MLSSSPTPDKPMPAWNGFSPLVKLVLGVLSVGSWGLLYLDVTHRSPLLSVTLCLMFCVMGVVTAALLRLSASHGRLRPFQTGGLSAIVAIAAVGFAFHNIGLAAAGIVLLLLALMRLQRLWTPRSILAENRLQIGIDAVLGMMAMVFALGDAPNFELARLISALTVLVVLMRLSVSWHLSGSQLQGSGKFVAWTIAAIVLFGLTLVVATPYVIWGVIGGLGAAVFYVLGPVLEYVEHVIALLVARIEGHIRHISPIHSVESELSKHGHKAASGSTSHPWVGILFMLILVAVLVYLLWRSKKKFLQVPPRRVNRLVSVTRRSLQVRKAKQFVATDNEIRLKMQSWLRERASKDEDKDKIQDTRTIRAMWTESAPTDRPDASVLSLEEYERVRYGSYDHNS